MAEVTTKVRAVSHRRLFVWSLASPNFAIALSNILLTLLLVEIAANFQVNEGIAVQLRTVNALAEVIFGFLLGFLITRFKHKSLLLIGALLISISAAGNFFALSFDMMLFFFFLEGVGSVIVSVVVFTLIGDLVPLYRKAKVVGWITAAGFLAIFIGTPLLNFSTNLAGWRFAFLLVILPISIAALVLVLIGVPKPAQQHSAFEKTLGVRNFKQIFSNKSATMCLLGNLFLTGLGSALFIMTFLRQQFSLPREGIVYVTLIATFILILGCLFSGKIGNKVGAKFLAVFGSVGSGILIMILFLAPNLWVALACEFLQVWFTGIALTAYNCLVIEQDPKARGTMMSLSRLFSSTGGIIAPAIGGTMLVLFATQTNQAGYPAVGFTFGAMNIIAATLFLATKDPYKTQQKPKHNTIELPH